jgi:hypothetical protein
MLFYYLSAPQEEPQDVGLLSDPQAEPQAVPLFLSSSAHPFIIPLHLRFFRVQENALSKLQHFLKPFQFYFIMLE